jgi:hypothetical protein
MLRSTSSLNSVLLKQIQADSSKPRTEIAGFKLIDFKQSVFDGEYRDTIRWIRYFEDTFKEKLIFYLLTLFILRLFGPTPTMLSEKWKLLGKWSKFNASPFNKMHGRTSSKSWIGTMIASSLQICQLEIKN